MTDWIFADIDLLPKLFISTLLIFILLILIVRISGLRSFAKMTAIDFASTIAIGSVLASTVISETPSIMKGGFVIASILFFQTMFSKLTMKFEWFDAMVSNQPLLLMDGPNILYDNLHAVNLSEGDLMAKLREANVIQLTEVKAVIMETTGDISVLHGESSKMVDNILIKDIRE